MPGFGDLHKHLSERQHASGSLSGVSATYTPAGGEATTPFLAIVDSGDEKVDQFGQFIARSRETVITVPITLPGTPQDRIVINAGPFAGTTWIVQRELRTKPGTRDLHCTRQEVANP